MQHSKQWIHFDAAFPLGFGHDLRERFGPAGELLFVHFLCACKRSFPQGQVHYRTEEEARALLGAHYPFIHSDGQEWTLEQFWRWCGTRKVTRTRARGGRRYVYAARWEAWEDARNAKQRERRRRSKAENRGVASPLRGEVGGVSKSPPTPSSAPTGDDTTSAGRRGNGHQTPKDPLVDWIRTCVPGTSVSAARQSVNRLRRAGIGDVVIEEAAGFAAEHGAASARYVEQVAADWMAQRDPTWNTEPRNGTRP